MVEVETSLPEPKSEAGLRQFRENRDLVAKWRTVRACALSERAVHQQLHHDYFIDTRRWNGDDLLLNIARRAGHLVLGLPIKYNLEVTTQCIFKCDFCVLHSGSLRAKRRKAFMDFEDFSRIFAGIASTATHIELTGGEPLLNKDLFRMLRVLNEHRVKTTLSTNAKLLNDKNRERILDDPPSILNIAFETGEEQAYQGHRKGGNIQVLQANIAGLVRERAKRGQTYPLIQLQTVISRKTVPFIDRFWEAAKNLEVDMACTKPLFIWPDGSEPYRRLMLDKYLIPDHPLSYYQTTATGELAETGIPGYCPNTNQVHIGAGGEIIPCWYNLLTSPSMGNAARTHFFDIWYSKGYTRFRERMAQHTAYDHGCRYCIGIYRPELFETRIFGDNAAA